MHFYFRNKHDDVVAIVGSNGSTVVQHKYDAWGNPIRKPRALANALGTLNSFLRYKNLPFPGTKLFSVGVVLNYVFSKLFEAIEAGETIDMPVEVKQAIHFYFHQLGVDIEDRLKGLYYSIPDWASENNSKVKL